MVRLAEARRCWTCEEYSVDSDSCQFPRNGLPTSKAISSLEHSIYQRWIMTRGYSKGRGHSGYAYMIWHVSSGRLGSHCMLARLHSVSETIVFTTVSIETSDSLGGTAQLNIHHGPEWATFVPWSTCRLIVESLNDEASPRTRSRYHKSPTRWYLLMPQSSASWYTPLTKRLGRRNTGDHAKRSIITFQQQVQACSASWIQGRIWNHWSWSHPDVWLRDIVIYLRICELFRGPMSIKTPVVRVENHYVSLIS